MAYHTHVCTACGVSTNETTCPDGCQSNQDPTQPKATLPWSQVPTTCWDCGEPLHQPPHQRAYLGLGDNCTAQALALRN